MGRNNTVSVNARFIGAFTNSTYPDAANVAEMSQMYISDTVSGGLAAGFYSNIGGVWTFDGASGTTLPDQTGHAGEFLQTDGAALSWATAGGASGTTLPDQTGHAGEFLQTDGAALSWATAGGGGGAPFAWCLFDGTLAGTNAPRAGSNVADVTRLGVGTYRVNFAAPAADVNYAALMLVGWAPNVVCCQEILNYASRVVTSVTFQVYQVNTLVGRDISSGSVFVYR